MDRNITSNSSKRKHAGSPMSLPASKHMRPGDNDGSDDTAFLDGFDSDGVPKDLDDMDVNGGAALNMLPADAEDSAEWQETIEMVVKSVVSIHFCQTASFDTELSMASQATGFVVDAERGYILTNRHVVCSGPFWGYCIFDNHEEVGYYLSYFLYLTIYIWSIG